MATTDGKPETKQESKPEAKQESKEVEDNQAPPLKYKVKSMHNINKNPFFFNGFFKACFFTLFLFFFFVGLGVESLHSL